MSKHRFARTRFATGADVYVVPTINGRLLRSTDVVNRLLLAAEVLSPSSARHDRFTKRRFLQKHRVSEYWIVDPEAQAFEVWHPDDDRPALIDDHLTWHPEGAGQPFELDVRAFFESVAAEDQGT